MSKFNWFQIWCLQHCPAHLSPNQSNIGQCRTLVIAIATHANLGRCRRSNCYDESMVAISNDIDESNVNKNQKQKQIWQMLCCFREFPKLSDVLDAFGRVQMHWDAFGQISLMQTSSIGWGSNIFGWDFGNSLSAKIRKIDSQKNWLCRFVW